MTNSEHFTDDYLNQVAEGGTSAAPVASVLLLFPRHLRQEEYDSVTKLTSHPGTIVNFLKEAFAAHEVKSAWPAT